jgi:hypothetical protein
MDAFLLMEVALEEEEEEEEEGRGGGEVVELGRRKK